MWAPENTRAAIFDGMKRKETFGTSGPRMQVRLFGGFGLSAAADYDALVKSGYEKGVPMGGEIAGGGKQLPSFGVWAIRDANSGTLDGIQIIKGWVDDDGEMHEKIFDVAWSGDRKPAADGKLPPVGNTVDVKTATFTDAIGSSQLLGHWTDPEFDPKLHSYYYARVLQVPTPRWSTYDAVRNDLPLLGDVPATVQERAWSSPIWHQP